MARGVVVVQHARLQFLDDQAAVGFGLRVDLVGQPGGLGALLRRKLEHTHTLDLGLLQKAAQLGKFLLGLARQADDQAGAQHKAGDARAQILNQRGELFPVARAVHGAQDAL